MTEPQPVERTPAQRQADHAGLARLSESLLPALVEKLSASGLGELEVREGDWRIRLRRSNPSAGVGAGAGAGRRAERPRLGAPAERDARGRDGAGLAPAPPPTAPSTTGGSHSARREPVTSPAVGVFRAEVALGAIVRTGDRIASVDLLGIAQEVVAPIDGRLVEILAQSGEAVEYGEAVAEVEPDVVVETDGGPTPGDDAGPASPDTSGEASA